MSASSCRIKGLRGFGVVISRAPHVLSWCFPLLFCLFIYSLMLQFLRNLCQKLPFMPKCSVSSCSPSKFCTFHSIQTLLSCCTRGLLGVAKVKVQTLSALGHENRGCKRVVVAICGAVYAVLQCFSRIIIFGCFMNFFILQFLDALLG